MKAPDVTFFGAARHLESAEGASCLGGSGEGGGGVSPPRKFLK